MFAVQPQLGGACQWTRRLPFVTLGTRLDEYQVMTFELKCIVWVRVGGL